jgi:hypothetical protein
VLTLIFVTLTFLISLVVVTLHRPQFHSPLRPSNTVSPVSLWLLVIQHREVLSFSLCFMFTVYRYLRIFRKKKKGWNEESIRRMSNCDTLIDKQKTTRAGLKKFISNMVLQKICYLPHVLLTTWRHASERRSDTCIYYTWPHGHM